MSITLSDTRLPRFSSGILRIIYHGILIYSEMAKLSCNLNLFFPPGSKLKESKI
jgi:hypothetical protein